MASRRAFDALGLRRGLGDRGLPFLVAAMTFLAALALAGSAGAGALAQHWRLGAAGALTVQVPDPDGADAAGDGQSRLAAALAALRGASQVADAHALSPAELSDLLRPWLGDTQSPDGAALRLPGVIAARMQPDATDLDGVRARLTEAVPGAVLESHGAYVARLAQLTRSLQACAWLAVALVGAVAAAVVATATRAGLAARRETIEIVHGLGAPDGWIARRFARRTLLLAAAGGLAGAVVALPFLAALGTLADPFVAAPGAPPPTPEGAVPPDLALAVAALVPASAIIGYVAARATVHRWLRSLP